MKHREDNDFHKFPKGERVEFIYLAGRYHTFMNNPYEAVDDLLEAFQMCAASSLHNKRAILMTLIPAMMVQRGTFPTERLLQKYHLTEEYLPLISALKRGDPVEYSRILLDKFDFYTGLGVYVWLSQLKVVVYRNLFKKVYDV